MKVKLLVFAIVLSLVSLASYFLYSRSSGKLTNSETELKKETEEANHPAYEEPAAEGETYVVEIKDSKFTPNTLKIEHGSVVAFVNRDTDLHTVTSDTAGTDLPGSFDLGELKTDEQVSAARYDNKGEYTYHCKIHPEMKGKIIVH